MAKLQITLTITEFCLHTGVTESELAEVVGLGVIQPRDLTVDDWLFDDGAVAAFNRAQPASAEATYFDADTWYYTLEPLEYSAMALQFNGDIVREVEFFGLQS